MKHKHEASWREQEEKLKATGSVISSTVGMDNKISQRELDRIALILKNYSLKALKVERVRSVYKITTDGRIYCLKRIKSSSFRKAEKGAELSKYLVSNGFYNIAKYVKTNHGGWFVKGRHSAYYLTEWIKGREVNPNQLSELKSCASLLADFHNAAQGFSMSSSSSKMSVQYGKMSERIEKDKLQLSDIKRSIDAKSLKTPFDVRYHQVINVFIEHMTLTQSILEEARYAETSMQAEATAMVCHDSFYYQNLLLKRNNKICIIDLDSCVFDLSLTDLAKFIRRILYKKIYSWDFEVAKELILEYSQKRSIAAMEYEILLALIIYPHKFWKLGLKKYSTKKKWPESKYLRKLDKVCRMQEKQSKFIASYLNCFVNANVKISAHIHKFE